ncbi:MAG: DUF3307 domain-containing protein [bacterium]
MYLFLRLLLAHVLADFPLQFDSIFRMKTKSIWGIALHSLIFALCAMLLSIPFLHQGLMWWYIVFLSVAHLVTDKAKFWLAEEGWENKKAFLLDQFIHIFWIGFISYWGNMALEPSSFGTTWLAKLYDNNILVIVIIICILIIYRRIILKHVHITSS